MVDAADAEAKYGGGDDAQLTWCKVRSRQQGLGLPGGARTQTQGHEGCSGTDGAFREPPPVEAVPRSSMGSGGCSCALEQRALEY